mmetsp:Transcript_71817/g.114325  ORF Transcript_71817/g.114325 Transcript_71817/m.114325 type:complete len:117 (-) Transcript_71817:611-961(-)
MQNPSRFQMYVDRPDSQSNGAATQQALQTVEEENGQSVAKSHRMRVAVEVDTEIVPLPNAPKVRDQRGAKMRKKAITMKIPMYKTEMYRNEEEVEAEGVAEEGEEAKYKEWQNERL